jgi:hypothetical protein
MQVLEERIYDRMTVDWLTPSQRSGWVWLQRFDGPPHRVVNIYGVEGSGKTFLGRLLARIHHSSYRIWPDTRSPSLPRMTIDDIVPDRTTTRSVRPLVDKYRIQQIILLSRARVDERAMPAFELQITEEDWERFAANLFKYLQIVVPEIEYRNYKMAVEAVAKEEKL